MQTLAFLAATAALAGCGSIQTYWSNDDAGRCVEHASQQYCRLSTELCVDSGPPTSDAGDLGATGNVMPCTP